MKVKIIKENGKIKINSPYNADFLRAAHNLNGKWQKPYWVFDEEEENKVRAACLEIYGENGLPQETVTLLVNLDEAEQCNFGSYIAIGKQRLCSRSGRDTPVRLEEGVILESGNFDDWGGSARYPAVSWDKSTEPLRLKVKNFPKAVYDRLEDKTGIELVINKNNREATLQAEKEKLLARLAEIETELKEVLL